MDSKKTIAGSIKKLNKREGMIYFLREYSNYSKSNSEKLIDFFLTLCSQCNLYYLTPSKDVEKTIQLIKQGADI